MRDFSKQQPLNISFRGVVISGDGFGKKLGYPTINITRDNFLKQQLDLQEGVYVGTVEFVSSGETFPAAVVLAPDAHHKAPKLEAHILHFSDDVYGAEVIISVHYFIRPYEIFETVADLKKAITQDVDTVSSLFEKKGDIR